ncbi:EamA family transporter [Scytonema sp. UIC 10036]|uniref:EamA family transporter n=1 Tax=Scytonema sp. UIC 10036 TaxID=2304196 RepID=UPI0012DA47CC|nr:EamA family transporter [Scytonema sp. UIC 10036]MUG91583.1 EamA family transporter [Scytonema sp. UIC 10036]
MGRFERRPDNLRGKGEAYSSAESAMRAITEELQIIQRGVLKSLQEDVKRLQADKERLTKDIQDLQEEKGQLQQEQQITQQQALIRQLSQVLASHISLQLQSSLETLTNQAVQNASITVTSQETTATSTPSATEQSNPNTFKLLNSLDNALLTTFNSLQQDLKNYQSSLSQQLARMHNQQKQGEAILAELVDRLHQELQTITSGNTTPVFQETAASDDEPILPQPQAHLEAPTKLQLDVNPPEETVFPTSEILNENPTSEAVTSLEPEHVEPASPPPVTKPAPEAPTTPKESSFRQIGISSLSAIGIVLIVLSTVTSSLYNVAIKVIFNPGSQIFGVFEVQSLLYPSLGSSLLLLMLRMLVVVPLMMLLAPILHPRVWHDMQFLFDSFGKNSNHPTAKRAFILSLVSGGFLFLSQLFIYLAIGQVPTGMAIALFFVYPLLSGLFSWVLFRDRLSLFSTGAFASIGLGELLVLVGAVSTGTGNLSLGSIAAIASGITFALYIVFSRICATKVHPVTFTLINFATMMVLSLVGLLLPLPADWSLQINPTILLELVLSAFLLGVLTLCGYLLNNFGVRKIGASRSAILSAIVPVLTAILAGFIIQETLGIEQVLGVLLVSCGAGALGLEKIRNIIKPSKSPN